MNEVKIVDFTQDDGTVIKVMEIYPSHDKTMVIRKPYIAPPPKVKQVVEAESEDNILDFLNE